MVFIFGKGAYGMTELDGGLKQYFVTGADSNNQFDTKSSLTYKFTGAAACLNPSAGCILFVHEIL